MNDTQRDVPSVSDDRTGEWLPTGRQMAVWQVGGALGLAFTFPLFTGWAFLFDGTQPTSTTVIRTIDSAAFGFILLIPVLIFHELCHGVGFRFAGAKPRYGFKLMYGMPCLYAAAPGSWLTKRQYLLVGLAPTIVVNAIGLVLMAAVPSMRHALVWALSMHFCGCIGDWTFMRRVLQLPSEATFEDANGVGFRYRFGKTT